MVTLAGIGAIGTAHALILGGLGFAIHILWWIALIVLVIWLIGFVVRAGEGDGPARGLVRMDLRVLTGLLVAWRGNACWTISAWDSLAPETSWSGFCSTR